MPEQRILIVDDNADELARCVEALEVLDGVVTVGERHSTEAAKLLASEPFDLLVTDLRMPMVDGLDLMRLALAQDPDIPVLILTGFPSVDSVLAALKQGAVDYLTKPVNGEELLGLAARLLEHRRLKGEHRLLERRLEQGYAGVDLVGTSAGLMSVFDAVRRLAESDVDVLIVGETGTGKELVARRIHRLSGSEGRFVPVDCGALPEHLMESELFGHEKGAFTGADRRSIGLLEFAQDVGHRRHTELLVGERRRIETA